MIIRYPKAEMYNKIESRKLKGETNTYDGNFDIIYGDRNITIASANVDSFRTRNNILPITTHIQGNRVAVSRIQETPIIAKK